MTGVGLNFVDQAYCSVFSHDSYLTSSNVHSSVTNLGAKNPPDSGKVGALLRMVMKIVWRMLVVGEDDVVNEDGCWAGGKVAKGLA